ncbi:DNA processing protein [Pseudoduganella flava]|uniref:DNA processing protein n=1 Tax=Pseudoduganella flava TaxID=871742 RepID=A0A562Q343_9BURK|nr:DNA-processing protein DprA [Pseudoduganella flava]QGZ41148.1 DNA-protecting protein DprA [Pseudoduganella flava]TWI51078.1 DNA processing protein [Pseudoduganella flava]
MQDTDSPLACWLRLATLPGLRRHEPPQLVRTFGTPQALFEAAHAGKAGDLSPALSAALRKPFAASLHALADATQAWAARPGNRLLTLCDDDYPPLLRQIPDPPLLLHVQGDPALLRRDAIAIVGSRNATAQGVANAQRFARTLADAGYTIVSGLARGIDAAAHDGGLAGTGSTVAVVGTGIDIVYPAAHERLAARIRADGCIVSEFVLGTPPRQGHFPIRNRIISGLSRGVLVVEAAEKSGSLVTAGVAAEQGRDVFAIPGSIHSALAKGCHHLIRQGALLVDTASDILGAFGHRDTPAQEVCREEVLLEQLTQSARLLLDALGYDPVPADTLAARLKLDAADTQASLLALELAGVVERLPGGAFCRLKR